VRQGQRVSGLTRGTAEPVPGAALRAIGEINPQTDWASHLAGVDVVVHLATRAHRPVTTESGLAEAKTAAQLAHAAKAAGVGRLILMSSIRAMGEATAEGERFRYCDPPLPQDAYGRAKLAIETALAAAASSCGLDLVVLRPPLVYGPGVKGNFRTLIRLAASGVPLPLAGFNAPRSLIFLDNLVDLLGLACVHPAAPGRVLLARDAVDLSLPELLRAFEPGLGRRVRLCAAPAKLLAGLAVVPALADVVRRISLPLLVDDAETRRTIGWMPAVAAEDGLALTARAWAGRA
jgi:nucleoside-diphosphate-sugar epimerase